jgi:hypothetical protein
MNGPTAGRFYIYEAVPGSSSLTLDIAVRGKVAVPVPAVYFDGLADTYVAGYHGILPVHAVGPEGMFIAFVITGPQAPEPNVVLAVSYDLWSSPTGGHGASCELWIPADALPGYYPLDLYVIGITGEGGSEIVRNYIVVLVQDPNAPIATPPRSATPARSKTPVRSATKPQSRTPTATPTASDIPSYTAVFAVRRSRVRKLFSFSYLMPIILHQ